MAVRIHIAGARNVTREDFLAAFAELKPQDASVVNGWCWIQASVWGVNSAKLDECLATLPGPCLRITSEDACRWRLRLFKQGQEPFSICHHFTRPGFEVSENSTEEADPPSPAMRADWLNRICAPEQAVGESEDYFGENAADEEEARAAMIGIADFLMDQREYFGERVPRELVARLLEMPYAGAMREYLSWHRKSLLDALKRFGIPHEEARVNATLAGESVSDREFEADLGNMPRFLADLGFGPQFESWVEELSQPVAEPEITDAEVSEFAAMVDQAPDFVVSAPDESPPRCALENVLACYLIAHYCDDTANVLFRVASKEDPAFLQTWKVSELGIFRIEGNTVLLQLFDNQMMFTLYTRDLLQKLIADLPDGAALEMITGSGKFEAGRQRYRGRVESGSWVIEKWGPPKVTAASLRDALALAIAIDGETPLLAESHAEIESVLESSRASVIFEEEQLSVDRKTYVCESWQRRELGALLFRYRFRDTWDVTAAEESDAAHFRDMQEINRKIEEQTKKFNAPITDDVIFDGVESQFVRGDIAALGARAQEAAPLIDSEFAEAGFRPLGDLCVVKLGPVVMRGYFDDGCCTFGVAYFSNFGVLAREFVSPLSGGATLTTTTSYAAPDTDAKRGIYVRVAPAKSAADLLVEHGKGIMKMAKRGLTPESIDPSLLGLTQAIDVFLQKHSAGEDY